MIPAGGRVLVTGARGFVGKHVCEELVRRGYAVRGLSRTAAPVGGLDGVEMVVARDLTDRPALRVALSGVDGVVHLAARVHVTRETAADPLAEFRRVNVEGTRALLDEAIAAGASTFVYASSVKAVGESSGDAAWTDDVVPRPQDPYGISKLEAEGLVRARTAETGLAASILRFPLVYGPGVGGNMLSLLRLVDRGAPLPLGGVRNRRSLAYAGNVAAAVAAVLASAAAGGETFFVSDQEDVSTPELIREIARAMGRPARLVPVPESIFRLAGRLGDVLRRAGPFPFHSGVAQRLFGSLAVDSSKLTNLTGWTPPVPLRQGMDQTVAWYRGTRTS